MTENKYTFKENGHQHLWDGKRMTGVTTVLGVIAKPALIGWAANMAVDYVKDRLGRTENGDFTNDENLVWTTSKKILEEARKAHTKKKEAAGDIGKLVHSAIEEYVKNGTEPKLDKQGTKMFENFKKWVADNKVKFLESEKHLYSEKLFVGGICDAIVEIDGQKWLADWKTGGTRIYPEAMAQMAGYEILAREMGIYQDITGYIVLGIFKDGTMEEKRTVSNDDCKKMFMAAYDIYRINQKIENQIL